MFKRLAFLFLAMLAVSACNGDKSATAAPAAKNAASTPAAPAAATAASAATPAREWQLGSDYYLIDPRVPTSTGDKVEVAFLNSLTQMAAAVHPETRPVLKASPRT